MPGKAAAIEVESDRCAKRTSTEHGYRPGGAALRMKRGKNLNYDAGDFFYCDDWH